MSQKHPGRVEDFTDAFLVSFGVLLFCMLFAIAALKGFIWALGTAFILYRILKSVRHRS